MAWLTANSLPKYWFNYPSDSNDQAPQWGITDTGGYGTNPYAIAVSNVGYSSQPARLLSNKFDVPLAGATISFKLYIPTVSDGVAYTVSIHDAVGGASLAVTGLTAGAGWKECSVLLTQGARCLEFRVTPDMYTDTFPKFVLDEVISYVDGVQANLLEAGGLGFAFPPGHQIPYGWENTGLTPFEAAYEGNVWQRPSAYPGVLRINGWDPTDSWFGELLSHEFTVPPGGITVSCKFTRGSNAWPWAQSSVAELILCDSAAAPTAVLQSQTLSSAETHYLLSGFVPEGAHRLRFKVRTPVSSVGAGDTYLLVNLTEVTPDLVAQGGEPTPPYSLVGWLAEDTLPPGWFNSPISTGYAYPAGDPQPQWGFIGEGPYALHVAGGDGVQGTTARLLTNVFVVPTGGRLLAFKFYNTAVDTSNGELIKFLNRSTLGLFNTNITWETASYVVSNFDPALTGWQTITLSLPEGENCIEFYIKRNSWASGAIQYTIDGLTDPLLKDGGIGVGFPYGYRMPPGWANTGAVPWVLGAENDRATGELLVYTSAFGVGGVQPSDYAELLSHVFTVEDAPLSASFSVYVEYEFPFNPTFSVLLCDENGTEVSTLYVQAIAGYDYVEPVVEIPVGTWSLRFRLVADFSQPYGVAYFDGLTPSLLAQGGQPVALGSLQWSAISTATVSDTVTYQGIFMALLSSSATGASVFSPGTLVSLTLASAATGDSDLSAQPVFAMLAISRAEGDAPFVTLSELELVLRNLITAQSGMPFPADDVETWVMNTETGGFTRYDGFNFNSYAKIGDSYYGCAEDGIYQLDGDTDNGEPIRAMVSFGKQNFGTSALKRITNAYVGVSGQGRLFLKVLAEGREYTYAQRGYDEQLQVQRFDTGKGLRVNWLEFELYNADGEDFELASVEFAAVPLSRRI